MKLVQYKVRNLLAPLIGFSCLFTQVCSAAPAPDPVLRAQADRALMNFLSSDSAFTNLFENAAAYAIFPKVTRTGHEGNTRGILFESDKPVGEVCLTETLGNSANDVKSFHELIFFENTTSLEEFKQGRFESGYEIKPMDASEGAALNARYQRGVVIFTISSDGRMVEVVIGHQNFKFQPVNEWSKN